MPDLGRIAGPVVIPSLVELHLVWILANGKEVKNILHGEVPDAYSATSTSAENMRAAIAASAAWTAYKPYLHTTCAFQRVDLRDIRSPNLALVQSTGGAVAGTGAGNALPPEVALAVTLRTNHAGVGFRGRVYLCGFDDAALNGDGTAIAGLTSAAKGFVDAVSTAMSGQGLTLSLAQPQRNAYTSPRTGRAIAARAPSSLPITQTIVRDNVFDSQRRRSR